ncbi:MAG: hypothetical protein WA446_09830 [Steroidobacteraceae bacterium]
MLPAVVMDAEQMFGTAQAVSTDPDGKQVALLRVAWPDVASADSPVGSSWAR